MIRNPFKRASEAIASPDASQQKPRRPLHPLVELMFDVATTYRWGRKNNLSLLSSSVSFFAIFSLIPLLILCFLGTRYILGVEVTAAVLEHLKEVVGTVMPSMNSGDIQNVASVLEKNALSSLFSIAVLCWSTYELFSCLHAVFGRLSARSNPRNFFLSHLISCFCFFTVVAASTTFLVLSTTPQILYLLFQGPLTRLGLTGVQSLINIKWITYGISMLGVLASITSIYLLMPTQRIQFRNALRGSAMFLVFFLLGRAGYQIFLTYYRTWNENLYGAFFTFITVISWIYYLSHTFLFSAQYTIYLQEKRDKAKGIIY